MTKDERIAWLEREVQMLHSIIRDIACWEPAPVDRKPQKLASAALDQHEIRVAEANREITA